MKTVNEIADINETLSVLSKSALREIRDFASYLADRERRHKKLVERVLKAEKEPYTECCTVEEVMQAIRNAPDDEDS
jgi:rubrerythrin